MRVLARLSLALLLAAACCCHALAAASSEPLSALGVVSQFARQPPSNPNTLVVIDDASIKQSHSMFFQQMQARGHNLKFVVAGEESIRLAQFGSFFYDNLVLFCPRAEDLGEGLTVQSVSSFVDSGRSLLVAVHAGVSEAVRELAAEVGIDIDEAATRVQDHAHFEQSDAEGMHDLILAELNPAATRIASDSGALKAPVLFRGVGHMAAPSEQLHAVLTGSSSAFSAPLDGALSEYPAATGRDVLLVSALQMANNARVLFSGSLDLFSNELMARPVTDAAAPQNRHDVSGNAAFVRAASMWAFHERGLLRARQLTHYKRSASHDVNPRSYRVSDEVAFSIRLEEWDGAADAWKPFVADDVQLELTMLDPYIRRALTPSPDGVYRMQLTVPDVYGVYKFVLNHRRVGLSNLAVSHVVSVHPFRHDEFERFLGVAYPYYAAAFSLMAGFFVFGIVFLYHKP